MKVFGRFLLSLPILFTAFIVMHAIIKLDFGIQQGILQALAIGLFLGLIIFNFVCRFKRFYVFGHEFAHWIFAKAFMKETGKFSVSKDGGAVQVKDPNIWVVLAPYFYPTFTVMWLPTWFIFNYFREDFSYGTIVFFAGLGLSWSYHLVLTLYALKFEQSDIQRCGKPLSFSIIILANTVFIFTILAFVTNGPLESLRVLWLTLCIDYSESLSFFVGGVGKLKVYIGDL